MIRYPVNATTLKTLDQFSYDTYSAISVNMLKYNHDTSATIRLLSTLINTSREVMADLPYQISFNLSGMDFISLDRLNGFYWPTINGFNIDEYEDTNCLFGYSRYTDKTYLLKQIDRQADFIRHSMPADSFFSGAVFPGAKFTLSLSPYIFKRLDLDIKDSAITIRPHMGFDTANLDSGNPIKITIQGIDIRGNVAKEDINIVAKINYITETEWKQITGVIATGSSATVTIVFHPYIAGDMVLSDNLIIGREQMEPSICVLTVNAPSKYLCYNALRENLAEYPLGFDVIKTVPLVMPTNHDLLSHYIDEPNTLLYAVHGKQNTILPSTTTVPAPTQTYYQWENLADPVNGVSTELQDGLGNVMLNQFSWNGTSWEGVLNAADGNLIIMLDGAYFPTRVIPAFPNAFVRINFLHSARDMYGNPTGMVNLTFNYTDLTSSVVNNYFSGSNIDMQTVSGKTIDSIIINFPYVGGSDYYGNPAYPGDPDVTHIYSIDFFNLKQGYEKKFPMFDSAQPGFAYGIYTGTPSIGGLNWNGDKTSLIPYAFLDAYGFWSGPAGTTTPGGSSYSMVMNLMPTNPESVQSIQFNHILIKTITTDAYTTKPLPYVQVNDMTGNIVLPWTRVDEVNGNDFITAANGVDYIHVAFPVQEWSDALGVDMFNAQVAGNYMEEFGVVHVELSRKWPTTQEQIVEGSTYYTEHTFSCYPLVIPITPDNTLDIDKTEYQAVSIEYEEDCVNEEWNMWLYPTSKTNDVESLNITINGETYIEGMLLDLIRFDIGTNRITIPFSDIYTDSITSAVVEIETYGAQRSYNKFRLDRTSLSPLYTKDLDNYLRRFKKIPSDAANWTSPTISSTKLPYKGGDLLGWGDGKYGGETETLPPKPFGYGGMSDINYNDYYELYKLSSTANVAINGQKIVNIFDTFYADEENKYVITSDTITHIKGAACNESFTVVSQVPADILAANGAVGITFSAPADPITLIAGNVNILGPAPYKYPGTYILG